MRMALFTTPNGSGTQRCILCPNADAFKSGMPANAHARKHVRDGEAANDGTDTLPRWVITDRLAAARLESDRFEPGDGPRAVPVHGEPPHGDSPQGGESFEPRPPVAHATPKAPTLDRAVFDDEDPADFFDEDDGPLHELNFDHEGR